MLVVNIVLSLLLQSHLEVFIPGLGLDMLAGACHVELVSWLRVLFFPGWLGWSFNVAFGLQGGVLSLKDLDLLQVSKENFCLDVESVQLVAVIEESVRVPTVLYLVEIVSFGHTVERPL